MSRLLLTLYAVLIIAMLALFVAAAWYLTLEMDEAWILLSTANVAGIPLPPTTALAHPVLTTGGLYLLLYALAMQGTTDIFVLRLISVIASALLLFVVYRILRRRGHPAARAAAGTVLFCAVPGFVLQAGMAMGEILATAALLPGLMICMRGPAGSYRNAIGGGLLLGLACATRIGCLPVLAGLLACALISPSDRRSRLTQAGIAVGLAALMTVLANAAYVAAAPIPSVSEQGDAMAAATGIGHSVKRPAEMLQSLMAGNEFLPFALIVAVAGCWAIGLSRRVDAPTSWGSDDQVGSLFWGGVAIWLAWVMVSPNDHLRYLWPGLACLWLAAVLIGLDVWTRIGGRLAALIPHVLIVLMWGYAFLTGGFLVAGGESFSIVTQAAGLAGRGAIYPHPRFQASKDQRALAAFMASRPGDAQFVVAGPVQAGYPLTYLSSRTIDAGNRTRTNGERWIIVQPADYAVWERGPAFTAWLRTNTDGVFRRGNNAAFRIGQDASPPPLDNFKVGMNTVF